MHYFNLGEMSTRSTQELNMNIEWPSLLSPTTYRFISNLFSPTPLLLTANDQLILIKLGFNIKDFCFCFYFGAQDLSI